MSSQASNSQLQFIGSPIYREQPEVNMLKVLDTYKRSVDFYNSYGLREGQNSTRPASRTNTESIDVSGTFWNL